MKKTCLVVALVMLAVITAQAQDCTSVVNTNVSSFPVVGNAYDSTVWHPLTISTNTTKVSVYRITINNSDPTVIQTVKFYEWGRVGVSSASVRLKWEDKVGGYSYTNNVTSMTVFMTAVNPVLEYWGNDGRWPLIFKYGLAVQKSSPSSTISVSVQYR